MRHSALARIEVIQCCIWRLIYNGGEMAPVKRIIGLPGSCVIASFAAEMINEK
jgi:hypothetical protein